MRPVNLIPPDLRRGDSAPTRTGPLVYVVVGGLAVIFVAVSVLALLGKQVDDKTAEVASLERQVAETQARAQSLSTYVSFQQMRDNRVLTIDTLAKSRFDWERVIREVSKIIPKQVWLSNMTGTVAPEVQVDDGAGIAMRSEVPGPALELVGCARSQTAIASLIAAMHDIDGVTRVTAANGVKSTQQAGAETEQVPGAEEGAIDVGGSCAPTAPSFQLVAAFDAVAVEGIEPGVDSSGAATVSTGSG